MFSDVSAQHLRRTLLKKIEHEKFVAELCVQHVNTPYLSLSLCVSLCRSLSACLSGVAFVNPAQRQKPARAAH